MSRDSCPTSSVLPLVIPTLKSSLSSALRFSSPTQPSLREVLYTVEHKTSELTNQMVSFLLYNWFPMLASISLVSIYSLFYMWYKLATYVYLTSCTWHNELAHVIQVQAPPALLLICWLLHDLIKYYSIFMYLSFL